MSAQHILHINSNRKNTPKHKKTGQSFLKNRKNCFKEQNKKTVKTVQNTAGTVKTIYQKQEKNKEK